MLGESVGVRPVVVRACLFCLLFGGTEGDRAKEGWERDGTNRMSLWVWPPGVAPGPARERETTDERHHIFD